MTDKHTPYEDIPGWLWTRALHAVNDAVADAIVGQCREEGCECTAHPGNPGHDLYLVGQKAAEVAFNSDDYRTKAERTGYVSDAVLEAASRQAAEIARKEAARQKARVQAILAEMGITR